MKQWFGSLHSKYIVLLFDGLIFLSGFFLLAFLLFSPSNASVFVNVTNFHAFSKRGAFFLIGLTLFFLGLLLWKALVLMQGIRKGFLNESTVPVDGETFVKAFRHSADVIGVTRLKDGCFIEVNDAFFKVFGFTRSEVIGKVSAGRDQNGQNSGKFGLWLDEAARTKLYSRLFDDGFFKAEEVQWCTKSGAIFTGVCSAEVVKIEGKRCVVFVWHDISQRKQAEDEIFASRQMLRLVFDTIPQRVFWKDCNFVFLGCNKPHAQDCGYDDPGDMIGKTDDDTASAQIAEVYRADDRKVMETGVPKLGYEEIQFRPDGDYGWLRTSKVPLRDKEGRVIGMLGTYEDITAQKKTEEALEKAHSKLLTTLESITDGFLTFDSDWRFTYLNPAAERIFGMPHEELIGKIYWDVFPSMVDSPIERHYRQVMETRQVAELEYFHPLKDLWFNKWMSIKAFPGEDGGISVYIRDITERKQAEEFLRQSHIELEIKVDQRTRELSSLNQELTAMNEELLTTNEYLQQAILELNREIAERQRVEGELAATNSELTRAIEKLKTMQTYLIQSEKMAALGNLVAGIAHEINTPIGVSVTASSHLQQIAEMLIKAYQNAAPGYSDILDYLEELRESAVIILKNMERASRLIQSFKQVSADQSYEVSRFFDIKQYLDEILMSIRPQINKTSHRVSVECDENMGIQGSPGAFSQIITNLVMNSLNHAFDPGDNGNILIKAEKEANELILTYSDDGKGMSDHILARIYDPFFTTKRGSGGTGLGLYVVYNVVTQQFGGTINCSSTLGAGTTYKICLPLQTPAKV